MLVFLQIAIVSYTYFPDILKQILSVTQIGLLSLLALVSLKQSNSIQSHPVTDDKGTFYCVHPVPNTEQDLCDEVKVIKRLVLYGAFSQTLHLVFWCHLSMLITSPKVRACSLSSLHVLLSRCASFINHLKTKLS